MHFPVLPTFPRIQYLSMKIRQPHNDTECENSCKNEMVIGFPLFFLGFPLYKFEITYLQCKEYTSSLLHSDDFLLHIRL